MMQNQSQNRDIQASSSQNAAFSCGICDMPDTEEMVQCDKCDKWQHFQCANVNESIADVSWLCLSCINAAKEVASKPPSKCPSSRKSKASSAKRREITLQRLEEEKAMAEKIAIEKIELEKRALNEREERFREYLRQKSIILIDDLSESEEGSVTVLITVS